jgi:hypothetical protein
MPSPKKVIKYPELFQARGQPTITAKANPSPPAVEKLKLELLQSGPGGCTGFNEATLFWNISKKRTIAPTTIHLSSFQYNPYETVLLENNLP